MLSIISKLIAGFFSPGFGELLNEVMQERRREESRRIEEAKAQAQESQSTGDLQKEVGRLVE